MQANLTWSSTDGEVQQEQVEKIEAQLGVKLPNDYIEVARVNNGGCPSFEAFDFEGREEAVFNRLLSLHEDQTNDILNVFDWIQDRLVHKIYPFASDPFGNYLCFDYRNSDKPSIVFWHHEVAFENPERALTYVADSFTELLSKLYD